MGCECRKRRDAVARVIRKVVKKGLNREEQPREANVGDVRQSDDRTAGFVRERGDGVDE